MTTEGKGDALPRVVIAGNAFYDVAISMTWLSKYL